MLVEAARPEAEKVAAERAVRKLPFTTEVHGAIDFWTGMEPTGNEDTDIEMGAGCAVMALEIARRHKMPALVALVLRDMIVASQKAKAKVLLVGMQIPPNYGRDYTQKFSSLYTTLAKETKVNLVPFLLEGIASKPELFQADRLHPIADAQPIILNNVWPYLKSLLVK